MDAPLEELMILIVSRAEAVVPRKHLPVEWITASLATKCGRKINSNIFKGKLNFQELKVKELGSVVMSASPQSKIEKKALSIQWKTKIKFVSAEIKI